MDTQIPAFNPTDRPVVIDDEGRQLGGGEWGRVDPDASPVVTALGLGALLVYPDGLGDDPDPEIARAVGPPRPAKARRS